jgi:hypothetical protein
MNGILADINVIAQVEDDLMRIDEVRGAARLYVP